MSITAFFEQLASTTHHKINLEELLKERHTDIQQAFANNDISSLKAFFNKNKIVADRTTIFEL